MSRITILDKEYDREKSAEALGIGESVLNGECDICPSVAVCSSNGCFKFPKDAACMIHKREILQSWAIMYGGQDDG
jgi:hypothetical protein